jgi:MFS family permease
VETLRRYPALRALWIARVVSFLGDSIGLVALIIFMTERTDSSAAVGLLLLAGDFTPALLAPLLGTLADRGDARRTMVACELGQALAVGLIVLVQPPVVVVLLLVAIRALLAATFQATSRSVVAELVDDADLEAANTVIGAGTYGLDAIGPLVAGALLLGLSARAVLAVDVVSFLVSPLLLLRLPRAAAGATTAQERLFAGAAVGLRAMRAHRIVWVVALGFFGVAAFTAVDDVALPFLGTDVFHSGDTGISLLYAGSGIGVLVGFALISRRRPSALHLALLGFVVSSVGNGLTGLSPAIAIAVVMQGVRGIGNGVLGVGVDTVIQREVPREVRGRVFANVYGGVGVAAGVSYVVGGALVDVVGPRSVLVGAGVGGLACGAIATWASGSPRTRTPPSPTAPSP